MIVQLTTEEQLRFLSQETQACHQWMNTTQSNLPGIIDTGRGIWYHLVGLGRVPGYPGSGRVQFTTCYPNVNYKMIPSKYSKVKRDWLV